MPTEDPEWGNFLQYAFLAVLEAADEGLIVFDGEGRCRMIGRRAGDIFGLEPAAYVGRSSIEVLSAFARACEEPDTFLQAAVSHGQPGDARVVTDVDVRRPRPRAVVCEGVSIPREGRAPGRLVVVRDVTRERAAERASKQLQARLAELTPYDTLTGLLNQRRFREELEREHGRSTRAWDSYAVLRMDIDEMGALNEEFGLPVGDQVLEQIAGRFKVCLREYDILARIDGDEFGVLLPGADALGARAVGERMQSAIMAEGFGLDGGREVTVSVGGALWVPPSAETGDDIVRRAGYAVDHARGHGRGRIHVDAAATPSGSAELR